MNNLWSHGAWAEEEWSLYRDALRLFQLIIYY